LVSVLLAGGRLQHSGPGSAVCQYQRYDQRPLWPAARRLSETAGGEEHFLSDRFPAHTDWRRVHVQLRKYERRARPVVEPGKRHQSRNPSESGYGQIQRLAELERRLLFQPLLLAVGFLSLYPVS